LGIEEKKGRQKSSSTNSSVQFHQTRDPVHDYLISMGKRRNGAYPYKFNEVVHKFTGFEYKFNRFEYKFNKNLYFNWGLRLLID